MKSSLDTYALGLSVAVLLITICPVVFSGRLPLPTLVPSQNSVAGFSTELEIEPEPELTMEPESDSESESLRELENQLPDFHPQSQPVKRSNSIRYCGGRLVKVVQDFCHGNVFPGYSNRAPTSNGNRVEGVSDWRGKSDEITQECCYKACALKDLTKYCGSAANRLNTRDSA